MRVYKAKQWRTAKTQVTIPIGKNTNVDIEVQGFEPIHLYGMIGGQKMPLKSGGGFRFRGKLQGFSALRLETVEGISFGYSNNSRQLQEGEPLNDDNPPDPPMPRRNLLAQIREQVQGPAPRAAPRSTMEPEDDLPNRYEVGEDYDLFEEEEYELERAAADERKNTSAPDADGGGDPADGLPGSGVPTDGPESAGDGPGEPSGSSGT